MGCGAYAQQAYKQHGPPAAAPAAGPPLQASGRASHGFHSEYMLPCKLGQGHHSSVYLAKGPSGDCLAIKAGDLRCESSKGWSAPVLDKKRWQAAVREVALLKRFAGQECIVQVVDSHFEGGLCYIVMELCDVPLLESLKRSRSLTESTLKRLFWQMLHGIDCVHAAGIVHRDIKPDNFMCKGLELQVKLCDFGSAVQLPGASGEDLTAIVGTPAFMAPEMLDRRAYDKKVDLWSFGVMVYTLFFGRMPYEPAKQTKGGIKETKEAMKAAIVSGEPAPEFKPARELLEANRLSRKEVVSNESLCWLQALLSRQPSPRLSAEEALHHSVFRTADEAVGQASLKPMLLAAVQLPAFSSGSLDETTATSVDVRVGFLQGLPNGQTPPLMKASVAVWIGSWEPAVPFSSEVGSEVSGGSKERAATCPSQPTAAWTAQQRRPSPHTLASRPSPPLLTVPTERPSTVGSLRWTSDAGAEEVRRRSPTWPEDQAPPPSAGPREGSHGSGTETQALGRVRPSSVQRCNLKERSPSCAELRWRSEPSWNSSNAHGARPHFPQLSDAEHASRPASRKRLDLLSLSEDSDDIPKRGSRKSSKALLVDCLDMRNPSKVSTRAGSKNSLGMSASMMSLPHAKLYAGDPVSVYNLPGMMEPDARSRAARSSRPGGRSVQRWAK